MKYKYFFIVIVKIFICKILVLCILEKVSNDSFYVLVKCIYYDIRNCISGDDNVLFSF